MEILYIILAVLVIIAAFLVVRQHQSKDKTVTTTTTPDGTKITTTMEGGSMTTKVCKDVPTKPVTRNGSTKPKSLVPNKSSIPNDRLEHLINETSVNPSYRFNLANLPVTTLTPPFSKTYQTYIKPIREYCAKWNRTLRSLGYQPIRIKEVDLMQIMKCDEEFQIEAILSIRNGREPVDLRITLYGKLPRADDFGSEDEDDDEYDIQLVAVRRVDSSDNFINSNRDGEFFTRSEQLRHMEDVEKMHREEQILLHHQNCQ